MWLVLSYWNTGELAANAACERDVSFAADEEKSVVNAKRGRCSRQARCRETNQLKLELSED